MADTKKTIFIERWYNGAKSEINTHLAKRAIEEHYRILNQALTEEVLTERDYQTWTSKEAQSNVRTALLKEHIPYQIVSDVTHELRNLITYVNNGGKDQKEYAHYFERAFSPSYKAIIEGKELDKKELEKIVSLSSGSTPRGMVYGAALALLLIPANCTYNSLNSEKVPRTGVEKVGLTIDDTLHSEPGTIRVGCNDYNVTFRIDQNQNVGLVSMDRIIPTPVPTYAQSPAKPKYTPTISTPKPAKPAVKKPKPAKPVATKIPVAKPAPVAPKPTEDNEGWDVYDVDIKGKAD